MHQADLKHHNKALQDKLESLYSLNRGRSIDLSFRPPYLDLLEAFGNPHENLPPIVHVAGTNGKGSTIAIMRSILEAAGFKVHVYTSPHLLRFNERIVLAGEQIDDLMLEQLIDEALILNDGAEITFFEITSVIAFEAFKRVPADIVLLEVGMGGRLDCTNIISKPDVSLINRVSNDHMEYLGNTLDKIIREKAGIMKYDTPCIIGYQDTKIIQNCQKMPMDIFVEESKDKNTPLFCAEKDWFIKEIDEEFIFCIGDQKTSYPKPNLIGHHQIQNSGLALAALYQLRDKFPLSHDNITEGLKSVHWPGRMQRITNDNSKSMLTSTTQLWYDGGHNDSAGYAIGQILHDWKSKQNIDIHIILGMKADKNPEDFLRPILPYTTSLTLTKVNDIGACITMKQIEPILQNQNIQTFKPTNNVKEAIKQLSSSDIFYPDSIILICGSLYLGEQI